MHKQRFWPAETNRRHTFAPARLTNPCYNSSHASGRPHAGDACQKAGVAMIPETLYALAACATVCGFLYEVAKDIVRFVKRKKTRKRMMQRKEAGKRTSRNE